MFNRKVLIVALLFTSGALIGGLTVELAHHQDDTKILFARKQKCQTIAAAYEKKFDDLEPEIETLVVNTDYSPARSSCVAIVITKDSRTDSGTGAVVDVLTDQTLFVRPFSNFSETGGRRKDVDEAFQKSLHHALQP